MSPENRVAYGDAYAVAVKRVPKGQIINHVIWRDDHLTVIWEAIRAPEPLPDHEPGRRSVLQGELL